jgi:hypothetical protein
MAGFFGLFSGRKAKFVDEPDTTPVQPQNKKAFFLSNDEAKTLGDTKFMRTPITIKRTFAKGGSLVQEISSMEKRKVGDNGVANMKGKETTAYQQPESVNAERRQNDSSMDMFRDMARSIKK